MANLYIDQLSERKCRLIDALHECNDYEGIFRLLRDLYPDNAHFLFELLQNAEDVGAKTVRFSLTHNQIVFEHDGRSFSEEDVDGITGIGNTQKKDDLNTIGKFGVGFKAVFGYTNTPSIYCDSFDFGITEMVCPIELDHPQDLERGITRFIFPFDNEQKSPDQAFSEIRRGLEGFSPATLLFLRHIKEIRTEIAGEEIHRISIRRERSQKLPVYRIERSGNRFDELWLRLDAPCEEAPEQNVSIAFKLDVGKSSNKRASYQIADTDGALCIYFPADKERTNLRFHIHAPFISTVARDSIPYEDEGNISLCRQVAELLGQSLPLLRDEGLLSMSFLEVLPNKEDRLDPFFEPIVNAAIEAMLHEELVPSHSGGFACAGELTRSSRRIRDVLDENDLKFLSKENHTLWALGAIKNSRVDHFLRMLEIPEWGEASLLRAITQTSSWPFRNISSRVSNSELKIWIEGKTIDWLRRFYLLLESIIDERNEQFGPIFLTQQMTAEFGDKTLYPSGFGDGVGEVYKFLHSDFLKGKSGAVGRLRTFFELAGVKEVDEEHLIEELLNKYYVEPDEDIVGKYHQKHIVRFVKFWKNSGDGELFSDYYFLLSCGDERSFCQPSQLYMDSPLYATGLSCLVNDKYPLSDEYQSLGLEFIEFVRGIGVAHKLEFSACYVYRNQLIKRYSGTRETDTSVNKDYELPASVLGKLKLQSYEVSKLVWNTMCDAPKSVLFAAYRPNQQYSIQRENSMLVQQLQGLKWIPASDGCFYSPKFMTREMLKDDFEFRNKNGWLSAIEFGSVVQEQQQEYKELSRQAARFGFESVDQARTIAALIRDSKVPLSEIQGFIQSRSRPELPKKSVSKPSRREDKVLEYDESAPAIEKVKVERTIQKNITQTKAEAKAYLRMLYTNEEDILVCQCCRQEMPFKVGGEYYFEAVQFVSEQEKRRYLNRLALCPVCAAKYKHARETSNEELCRMMLNEEFDDQVDSVTIPLILAGETCEVYFVGTHWFDLKTLIASSIC